MDPVSLARTLSDHVRDMAFQPPVNTVYNPLDYAWKAHEAYLRRFANPAKRVVFLGMNPGPWGMAQTGVPFGEIAAVRDWMGIREPVGKPAREHPGRPIEGFDCAKSEVSGRRLWGLFAERFGTAEAFFRDHFVANWCPLVFMSASGANITPDKLPAAESMALATACDAHLEGLLRFFRPEWAIGVGSFAEQRIRNVAHHLTGLKTGRILHPSPASPAANRDWAGQATAQLQSLGVWPE
jgi:single-strand selective monofunctional uracil DNA glycosylase